MNKSHCYEICSGVVQGCQKVCKGFGDAGKMKNMKRISLYLDEKFITKMDQKIKNSKFKSRNDLVEYAVNKYLAEEMLNDKSSAVSEVLANEIAKASEEQEKRISKGLFRYAVELEVIMQMLALCWNCKPEVIQKLRKEAINNVRRTRGKVRLDDLFKRDDSESL